LFEVLDDHPLSLIRRLFNDRGSPPHHPSRHSFCSLLHFFFRDIPLLLQPSWYPQQSENFFLFLDCVQIAFADFSSSISFPFDLLSSLSTPPRQATFFPHPRKEFFAFCPPAIESFSFRTCCRPRSPPHQRPFLLSD